MDPKSVPTAVANALVIVLSWMGTNFWGLKPIPNEIQGSIMLIVTVVIIEAHAWMVRRTAVTPEVKAALIETAKDTPVIIPPKGPL